MSEYEMTDSGTLSVIEQVRTEYTLLEAQESLADARMQLANHIDAMSVLEENINSAQEIVDMFERLSVS